MIMLSHDVLVSARREDTDIIGSRVKHTGSENVSSFNLIRSDSEFVGDSRKTFSSLTAAAQFDPTAFPFFPVFFSPLFTQR